MHIVLLFGVRHWPFDHTYDARPVSDTIGYDRDIATAERRLVLAPSFSQCQEYSIWSSAICIYNVAFKWQVLNWNTTTMVHGGNFLPQSVQVHICGSWLTHLQQMFCSQIIAFYFKLLLCNIVVYFYYCIGVSPIEWLIISNN